MKKYLKTATALTLVLIFNACGGSDEN